MKNDSCTLRIVRVTFSALFVAVALGPLAIITKPAVADSRVVLRNEMNNKCLEILSFNNENGAQTGLWDCWGGANQQWYWDGRQIRNQMNNKCLEILGFHNENGAHVGMWDCWGGANQRWSQQ